MREALAMRLDLKESRVAVSFKLHVILWFKIQLHYIIIKIKIKSGRIFNNIILIKCIYICI